MFGYNESFDDDPAGYGNALSEWIEHTREQDYSGQGPPDIVLFSPIAHEDLDDPNVPDGSENNARLARYAEATRAVAEAQGLGYVDLFTASHGLYGSTEAPLTINGVHLNDEGNRRIAEVILRRVTGQAPSEDEERLASIRTAVLDKNLHWHNRYRATDGNDVWGTRSTLSLIHI